MKREEMIAIVDQELRRLERIRALLAESHSERFTFPEAPAISGGESNKRSLSPEAKRRIGQAQKRRWAKQKHETNVASGGK